MFVPHTDAEREEMLRLIGVERLGSLYRYTRRVPLSQAGFA